MPKKTTHFVCQNCGAIYARWAGKCDACGEWNTIQEEALPTSDSPTATGGQNGKKIEFSDLRGAPEIIFRLKTGIGELDRVCGGGLVPGSVILVGGDPGIGKSTLLLQAVASLTKGVNKAGSPTKCSYISGEESVDQVRLRALRLGLADNPVDLASETHIRDIVATLDTAEAPDIVIIDSIQTMYADTVESAPGTVAQVRACGHELIRLAKKRGFVLFLVGHVTKEGTLAGPRVLEHMVDTVLYFEGDRDDRIFILQQGHIILTTMDDETQSQRSSVLNPGEFFGIKSALVRCPREETVTAGDNATCVVLSVPEFENLFSTNKQLMMKMLRVFSKELRDVHGRTMSLLNQGNVMDAGKGLYSMTKAFYDEEKWRGCIGSANRLLKIDKRYSESKDFVCSIISANCLASSFRFMSLSVSLVTFIISMN